MGKTAGIMKQTFSLVFIYNDGSKFSIEVTLNESESSNMANLMMIARGTLKASSARYAYCYDTQGNQVLSYRTY